MSTRPANNQTRNADLVALVVSGLSYAEAAAKMSVSRNVVAGVCDRAGLKLGGIRPHHVRDFGNRVRAMWANPEFRWHYEFALEDYRRSEELSPRQFQPHAVRYAAQRVAERKSKQRSTGRTS